MAGEVESIDWFLMVESTDFNLNINFEMILRSTREDLVVEEDLVMSSVLRNSINLGLNSINSSLLILSSFMPGNGVMLTCSAHAFSRTQNASAHIFRDGTDPMSE